MKKFMIFLALGFMVFAGSLNADETIIEDAEDGTTSGWSIYDPNPLGAAISNVVDTEQGKVIKLTGSGTANGYMLGHWGSNGFKIANKKLSWKMKYDEVFTIYITVKTEDGNRYLTYTAEDNNRGLAVGGRYIHHGLGSNAINGVWQTFSRDLEVDLKEYLPSLNVLEINAFLIRGSGYIDDITSLDNFIEEHSPIANAGDDKNVELNTPITITGSATDDGLIVSYKWEENGVELATTASFDYISSVEGPHTLVLTVTDDDGLTGTDTMIVGVSSEALQPPVAIAGDDVNITEGETVDLDASASFDPNGSIISYEWSENGIVFASTALYSLANLPVGEHTIQVKVTDNDMLMATDTLIVNVIAGTNQGVSFHTAFLSNYDTSGTLSFFISSVEDTTGEIILSDTNEIIEFSVSAGDIEEIAIPIRMMLSGTETSMKVIKITSVKDIIVVGLNKRANTTDAYLLLPDKLLGTEYYTVGYENILSDEFALIATEDNTIVNITLANALGNSTVNLSKGEVYQYQQGAELTGSHISSNKNIAVVSGNQCTNIPDNEYACDHIVEQMLPVNTWEKEFITVPLKTRLNGDTFRIIASQDNSILTINGTVVSTLNAGEYYETILTTTSVITSNYPIMVAQYSNGTTFDNVTSDPFMALVPATAQYDTTHIINTPSGFTDYINLVVPTVSINDVQLDGENVNVAEFTVVVGTSFSSAQLQIASGKHTVTSNAKIGMLGYGFADYDSYGYPSSLRITKH